MASIDTAKLLLLLVKLDIHSLSLDHLIVTSIALSKVVALQCRVYKHINIYVCLINLGSLAGYLEY